MATAYQEYMGSDGWKKLREKAYLRAENLCELCGAKAAAVHHVKYPKNFEEDNLYNLLVVCKICHEKLHAIKPELGDEEAFYSATGEFTEEEVCPICSDNYAHLSKVAINKGGSITVIDHSRKEEIKGRPTGRGVSVWIHFRGECGHGWHKRWQFHKGMTFVDVVPEDKPAPDINTLWRD